MPHSLKTEMSLLPSAILFVNNDLTSNVRAQLVRQLFIDEVVDGETFDSKVSDNPNFVSEFKSSQKRMLVERSLSDLTNRELADVVIFVKSGLLTIEENKFGPPSYTYKVVDITWRKLGIS